MIFSPFGLDFVKLLSLIVEPLLKIVMLLGQLSNELLPESILSFLKIEALGDRVFEGIMNLDLPCRAHHIDRPLPIHML